MTEVIGKQQARYDEIYRGRTAQLYRPDTPTLTLRYLGGKGLLHAGTTLLDIGAGIGKDVRLAVTAYDLSAATGIDTSQQVIEDAKAVTTAQVEPAKADRIKFICGDILGSAAQLDRYDVITSTSVIHLLQPDEAVLFMRSAAALLNPIGSLLAVATKTTSSGDARPLTEGGKSVELMRTGPGYELHRSDDGLERFYYTPETVAGMLEEAASDRDIQTDLVVAPYGSVADCEFVIAVAK